MSRKPISRPPHRLRQRQRAAGWAVWWEPETAIRKLGFAPVKLDAERPTWSRREAARLNRMVDALRGGDTGARAATRAVGGRTVKALIVAYRASPKWDRLRPATRADYLKSFRLIEDKWGGDRVVDFDKPMMRDWYEQLYRSAGAHQASALLRKFSLLFSYAEIKGWRADNPCLRLGMVVPAPRNRVASWAEIEALLTAAAEMRYASMGCAIALGVFMGQRQTDIIEAGPGDFRDGHWFLVRSKRGNRGALKIHHEVAGRVARLKARGNPDRERLLVSELTGRFYDPDAFQDIFARVRRRASHSVPSVADLTFRDLRRTFGHMARQAGASERDVADALGNSAWTDPRISATYMPANTDTAARAIGAVVRPKKETGR